MGLERLPGQSSFILIRKKQYLVTLALVSSWRKGWSRAQTSIFTMENQHFLVQMAPQASWPSSMPLGLQNHCLGSRDGVIRFLSHYIWLCTCIQGCLHLHCIFMCMYTCICLCICVYACIAFALLLLCICICARIGQATKASCDGLQNDASQHIGMPDYKSKRVNSFLRHSLIISRNF